ncbi:MAG: hypothetical protein RQ783_09690 [Gammaproteobacteria bacterium]|nr:hypothetical protein [Gammaproteobacteria bacterium]
MWPIIELFVSYIIFFLLLGMIGALCEKSRTNKETKVILYVAITILVGMLAYPPIKTVAGGVFVGYGWLSDLRNNRLHTIESIRFLLQAFTVLITALFVSYIAERRSTSHQ